MHACRYGLFVGATCAPFVRLLMALCSPVAWPLGKLLDWLLGHQHYALFRRRQLKELVNLHGSGASVHGGRAGGGDGPEDKEAHAEKLTDEEIKIIGGERRACRPGHRPSAPCADAHRAVCVKRHSPYCSRSLYAGGWCCAVLM